MAVIDIELEARVLAAMLDNEDNLLDGLADLTADCFYESLHQQIFKTIVQMNEAGKIVNPQTVYTELQPSVKGRGTSWMLDSCQYVGTFEHGRERLKELAASRRAVRAAEKAIHDLTVAHRPLEEVLVELEDKVFALAMSTEQEIIVTPKAQAERIMNTVAAMMDDETRKKSCIYTTFSRLNLKTGGYEAGDLVIVSGPTGGGKTAFTMNQIRDIAIVQKLPVLYINTEMSEKQLDIRLASILSKDWGVNNHTIRSGAITQAQFTSLAGELDRVYQSQLYSVTIHDLTIPKMLSVIKRFTRRHNIRAVAIDYIGRMELTTGSATESRDEWKLLTNAARKLKTIAQQQNLVVFMLSQVDSAGKLALAKYMEHEADLHLHVRPITAEEQTNMLATMEPYWNHAVSIEKGRSSPKGSIPVRFVGEKLLFLTEAAEAEKHAIMTGTGRAINVPVQPMKKARR